jgi:hypothetical protein
MPISEPDIVTVLKALSLEVWKRLSRWLETRPLLRSLGGVLAVTFILVLTGKILWWLLWPTTTASLGLVSGRVTLEDLPVARATVEYTPATGSPSYGTTDEAGRYALMYLPDRPGAVIGDHTVRITTYDWVTERDGRKREIPERVPATYNDQSTLRINVERGRQTHDWKLRGQR